MKIFKFAEFINEAVSIPQVIRDFVDFLGESPVVVLYPEDESGRVREGWLSKEHKMYSLSGIKKYFKEKYGAEYASASVDNAIMYDPNIKILKKLLLEKGLTLQSTSLRGQFGETNWFYSVNLSDEEIQSIKSKYEDEFKSRYSNYLKKKADARVPAVAPKRRTRKRKNESLELLIEGLFNINDDQTTPVENDSNCNCCINCTGCEGCTCCPNCTCSSNTDVVDVDVDNIDNQTIDSVIKSFIDFKN